MVTKADTHLPVMLAPSPCNSSRWSLIATSPAVSQSSVHSALHLAVTYTVKLHQSFAIERG